MNVKPMQLAAVLLEKITEQLSEEQAEELVRPEAGYRKISILRPRASRAGVGGAEIAAPW